MRDKEEGEALFAALAADWRTAELDDAERTMLAYAEKLTREPWSMTREDVEALRRGGFSDTAVLDIAQVTAYYAYANRLADGLGVELEAFWGESG